MPELNESQNNFNITEALDQLAAMLRDYAPCVGTYFNGLIEAEVPHELACQLTLDWHAMYWQRQFGMTQGEQ
jgi:hypothetical protein